MGYFQEPRLEVAFLQLVKPQHWPNLMMHFVLDDKMDLVTDGNLVSP
jgi:hypothetical protein